MAFENSVGFIREKLQPDTGDSSTTTRRYLQQVNEAFQFLPSNPTIPATVPDSENNNPLSSTNLSAQQLNAIHLKTLLQLITYYQWHEKPAKVNHYTEQLLTKVTQLIDANKSMTDLCFHSLFSLCQLWPEHIPAAKMRTLLFAAFKRILAVTDADQKIIYLRKIRPFAKRLVGEHFVRTEIENPLLRLLGIEPTSTDVVKSRRWQRYLPQVPSLTSIIDNAIRANGATLDKKIHAPLKDFSYTTPERKNRHRLKAMLSIIEHCNSGNDGVVQQDCHTLLKALQQQRDPGQLSLSSVDQGLNDILDGLHKKTIADLRITHQQQKLLCAQREGDKEQAANIKQYLQHTLKIPHWRMQLAKWTGWLPFIPDTTKVLDAQLKRHQFFPATGPSSAAKKRLFTLIDNLLKHYNAPTTTADSKTEIRHLLAYLSRYQTTQGYQRIIRDETTQYFVNLFEDKKYTEGIVLTLWQNYFICPDKIAKKRLAEQLANQLAIPPNKLWWATYFGWLPFFTSQHKLFKTAVESWEYGSPNYNEKQTYINQQRQRLLMIYKTLLAKPPAEDAAEKIKKAHANKLFWTTQLLQALNTKQSFSGIDPEKIGAPDLRALVINFNKKISDTEEAYIKARYTIEKLSQHPITASWNIPYLYEDPIFDQALFPLLEFFVAVGGPGYLHYLLTHYFNYDAKNIIDHQVRLNSFLQETIDLFMSVQDMNFTEFGFSISEERKFGALNQLKKQINHWSEEHNLAFSIRKTPQHLQIYDVCQQLLTQLPEGVEKQRLMRIWRKQILHPAAPTDIQQLQHLHADITSTFKRLKVPYQEKIRPFQQEKREHTTYEKYYQRQIKEILDAIGSFFIKALAAGQAAVGAYSLLGLAPLTPLAAPLAVICFFATLYANIILFQGSTIKTLRQFFLFRDFFNGFTSPSGKALMLGGLGLALTMGFTMMVLVTVSTTATLLSIFPVIPAAILAPIALTMAVTTFIGFVSLMYRSLAFIINGACNVLQSIFPEIAKNGWGITGLITGFCQGMKRIFYTNIRTPGKYSPDGGYRAAVRETWLRLKNFWQNPTDKADPTPAEITYARIHVIVKNVIWGLAMILAVFMFGFATYATVKSAHLEMVDFLSRTNPWFTITAEVATMVSFGIVVCMAGLVRLTFNLRNIFGLFDKVADIVTDYMARPVIHLILHPIDSAQAVWRGLKQGFASLIGFGYNLYENPKSTLQTLGKRIKKIAIDVGSVILNGISNLALSLKNDLIPRGALSLAHARWDEWSRGFATFSASTGANSIEMVNMAKQKPLDNIPLFEALAKKQTETAATQVAEAAEAPPQSTGAVDEAVVNETTVPLMAKPQAQRTTVTLKASPSNPVKLEDVLRNYFLAHPVNPAKITPPDNTRGLTSCASEVPESRVGLGYQPGLVAV